MVYLGGYILEHNFGVMTPNVGLKSNIWRQRPDMTKAVDWNVKNQFKQNIHSPTLIEQVKRVQWLTCNIILL